MRIRRQCQARGQRVMRGQKLTFKNQGSQQAYSPRYYDLEVNGDDSVAMAIAYLALKGHLEFLAKSIYGKEKNFQNLIIMTGFCVALHLLVSQVIIASYRGISGRQAIENKIIN